MGSGTRAALWLDRFKALDEERGTGYYPRLRFLLGDYSLPTLDRAHGRGRAPPRRSSASSRWTRSTRFKTLSFLRYKILYIHLTNVYDNLPLDELVRRDGRLYLVETRAYLPRRPPRGIAARRRIWPSAAPATVERLPAEVGPEVLGDRARGVGVLARRLGRAAPRRAPASRWRTSPRRRCRPGSIRAISRTCWPSAPDDVRFHLSRGAAESFVNTLPLLHPRGYLQVQDIFVTAMDEYRHGFRGPGKLDGSVVNWVNGALLRAVGARAGYDVHFAPFRYRPGSRTSDPLHHAARLGVGLTRLEEPIEGSDVTVEA